MDIQVSSSIALPFLSSIREVNRRKTAFAYLSIPRSSLPGGKWDVIHNVGTKLNKCALRMCVLGGC